MKLLEEFKKHVQGLGKLRRVWLTSFNINAEFIEKYLLPALLPEDFPNGLTPKSIIDYEKLQLTLNDKKIDVRIFCDYRFIETDSNSNKRTSIPIHGIAPAAWDKFSGESLFHPKVIYLEGVNGKRVLGTGSANLTLSGWGRNQEAFTFQKIETKAQCEAVKSFFGAITQGLNLPEKLNWTLLNNAELPAANSSWRFVHSFQEKSFIEQFTEKNTANDLLVWSPYLSKYVPAFVEKLKKQIGKNNLSIHLVPDLINGKHIRTEYSSELLKLSKSGAIGFYKNPSKHDDKVELFHSKIWTLGNRLAVGSWNFTTRGANLPNNGAWNNQSNIEAGIIFEVQELSPWKDGVGTAIELIEKNFASKSLLEEEKLNVPNSLPFTIQVEFDWLLDQFKVVTCWLSEQSSNKPYLLKLPGLEKEHCLSWPAGNQEAPVELLKVSDAAPLLANKNFQILHNNEVVYRGLITEVEVQWRRAESFANIEDLLNAYVLYDEPAASGKLGYRVQNGKANEDIESEFADSQKEDESQATSAVSYFRLFQATHQIKQQLEAVKSLNELNRLVFQLPGCLLELVEKTKKNIEQDKSLFNWFLAQEVKQLCLIAHTKLGNLSKSNEKNAKTLSESRWQEINVKLPYPPSGIRGEFLSLIKEECGYA